MRFPWFRRRHEPGRVERDALLIEAAETIRELIDAIGGHTGYECPQAEEVAARLERAATPPAWRVRV